MDNGGREILSLLYELRIEDTDSYEKIPSIHNQRHAKQFLRIFLLLVIFLEDGNSIL